MISIDTAKLKMSLAKLKTVRKKVADTADGIYRQKIYYLLEAAARVSPQFSGDFASNWALVIDGDMPVYRPHPDKLSGLGAVGKLGANGQTTYTAAAKQAGDFGAVQTALTRGAAALRGVTTKNRVHLVNATELYTPDGRRMVGPDGTVNLRPENIIPGNIRIESYVRNLAKNPIKLTVPK
jgi:hypothetical protein